MPRFEVSRFLNSTDVLVVNARTADEAFSEAKNLLDSETDGRRFEKQWSENFSVHEITADEEISELFKQKQLAELKCSSKTAAKADKPSPQCCTEKHPVQKCAEPSAAADPAVKPEPAQTRRQLYELAKSKGLPANTRMNVEKLTALIGAEGEKA